jgi:uncharacterized protein YqfA (UPF0365 family)
MLQVLHQLLKLFSGFQLWVFARTSGISIRLGEILRMQSRNIKVEEIIRALLEAKEAGLAIAASEMEQGYVRGMDLHKVILTLIEARRRNMGLTFREVIDAESQRR